MTEVSAIVWQLRSILQCCVVQSLAAARPRFSEGRAVVAWGGVIV